MASKRPIEEIVDEQAPGLMELPGVSMVYVGALDDGTLCIKVGTVGDPDDLRERIPLTIEGYPVVLERTGEIRPMN